MAKFIASLSLVLLFHAVAFGQSQYDLIQSKVRVITGIKTPAPPAPAVIGDKVVVTDDSVIKILPAVHISVQTSYKFAAFDSYDEDLVIETLGQGSFLLYSEKLAKAKVKVYLSDPERGIYISPKAIDVELGPAPVPPPEPVPVPVPGPSDCSKVPPDPYGNIGQRTCQWAAGLPKRKDIAKVYAEAAQKIVSDPAATSETVSKELVQKRAVALGADEQKYATLVENIGNDIKSRWPMGKGDLSNWWLSVAKGLANE